MTPGAVATDSEALLRQARDKFAKGRADDSRRLCEELIARDPANVEGLHLLAMLELASGNAGAALAPVERASQADPGDARKHQTHGLVLRSLGRRDEAARAFARALSLSPEFPEAHGSLALARFEEGAFGEAARHFERALRVRADVYAWNFNLGLCRSNLGELAGAVSAFQRALQLNERMPEAHNNLGAALMPLERLAEAEASFRRCIELAPGHAHAWTNLGNVLRRTGRTREAQEAYWRATQCEPPLALAWVNFGNALKDADRVDDALGCFARAMSIEPALAEAHLSRAIACLLAGDLEQGWDEYRWRLGAAPGAGVREAVRDAIGAKRSIEIRGEQGLGDALFFLRWAAVLHEAGARLSFRGDPRLYPLLERTRIFRKLGGEEGESLVLPAGDLPWVAAGMAAPHPPSLPLEASAAALEAAGSLLRAAGPPPYIGIAWKAGLASSGPSEHLHKMVPLEDLGAALRTVPGTIVSLQRGARAPEIETLRGLAARPVLDAERVNLDLDATLGILARLDDYAGVSSTNVHLRAGLGKAARILVPLPPEWRYGRSGSATPWFEGFGLYREEREGGWARALSTLASDLARAHREP